MIIRNYIIGVILLISGIALSQEQEISTPQIRLKIDSKQDKVLLRWAIDEPIAWQKANKVGFVLKRYTLMRDGELLENPEEKNLGVFQPASEEKWKEIIETNDKAAIVAQSLFGESFEVEMGDQRDLQSIINKSQEIEQRFAYALMAADLDFEVAKLAGWGYVDTEVQPNVRYLYTVELNPTNNTKLLQIEKGSGIAELSKNKKLPKPLDFIGIFKDKQVTLAWDYKRLSNIYTAYFIEKAVGGKSFEPMGNLPVMSMNNEAPGMIYIDSLSQNDKKYSYRIRGKTIFGEYGPYSDVVTGSGEKGLKHTPRITDFEINPNEMVKLMWDFPKEAEKDIIGFRLLHSETDKVNSYHPIMTQISPSERSITAKVMAPSNYYKIEVLGKDKTKRNSFAVLVQPEDSTPPKIPTGLTGKIDSIGVVRLKWNPNTEKDLEGYHLFRADQKGRELLRITPQAIKQNMYQDTVQIANMGDKVYYYITAMDIRKNQSEPSPILELKKPDVVKPQAPVFKNYKIENGEITLNWFKSYSKDTRKYQLYRVALDESNSEPKIIFETTKIQPNYTYTDTKIQPNKRYRYYLVAIDENNLVSDKSQQITLRNVDLRAQRVINRLSGSANRNKQQIELFWKLSNKEQVVEILIYRQKGKEQPSLWGTLSGAQNFLEDKNVMVGDTYTYLLKAMLKNGQPTQTEKITIEY